jgi:hypothetical protein
MHGGGKHGDPEKEIHVKFAADAPAWKIPREIIMKPERLKQEYVGYYTLHAGGLAERCKVSRCPDRNGSQFSQFHQHQREENCQVQRIYATNPPHDEPLQVLGVADARAIGRSDDETAQDEERIDKGISIPDQGKVV